MDRGRGRGPLQFLRPAMAITVLVGLLALLVVLVVGIGIALFDLSGYREQRAEWLQMKIMDRLARDPRLGTLGLLPVVDVPVSKESPLRVEIHGQVPSDEIRDVALGAVGDAVSRLHAGVEIEDRLEVVRPAEVPHVA